MFITVQLKLTTMILSSWGINGLPRKATSLCGALVGTFWGRRSSTIGGIPRETWLSTMLMAIWSIRTRLLETFKLEVNLWLYGVRRFLLHFWRK